MNPATEAVLRYVSAHPDKTAREIAEGMSRLKGTSQRPTYYRLKSLCAEGLVVKYNRRGDGKQAFAEKVAVPKGVELIAEHRRSGKQSLRTILPDVTKLEPLLSSGTLAVLKRLKGDPHDRMHSWEHCFVHFQAFRTNVTDESADLAALHLAFFLASYGMYRGGTRLLQKDFRFLKPVVIELCRPQYAALCPTVSVAEASKPERALALWQACECLGLFLREHGLKQKSMGTLVTKILLGTWCNVPAFDRAYKQALKASGFGTASWSKTNFLRTFTALHDCAALFEKQLDRFHAEGFSGYPPMRVIDAIFWHLGGGDKKTNEGEIGL